jgi:hypothetical protein
MARLAGRKRVGAIILAIVALCLVPTHKSKGKVVVPGFQASLEAQIRTCRCYVSESVWQWGDPPVQLGDAYGEHGQQGNEHNMTLVSCAGTICQNYVNQMAATLCQNYQGGFVKASWTYFYYEHVDQWTGHLDQDIPCP